MLNLENAHSLYSQTVPLNQPSGLVPGCDLTTIQSPPLSHGCRNAAELMQKHGGPRTLRSARASQSEQTEFSIYTILVR